MSLEGCWWRLVMGNFALLESGRSGMQMYVPSNSVFLVGALFINKLTDS